MSDFLLLVVKLFALAIGLCYCVVGTLFSVICLKMQNTGVGFKVAFGLLIVACLFLGILVIKTSINVMGNYVH